jgi:hypothetical protein
MQILRIKYIINHIAVKIEKLLIILRDAARKPFNSLIIVEIPADNPYILES